MRMEQLQRLTDLLYGGPLMVLLLGTGLYFTVRTGVVQLRGLPKGVRALRQGGNLRAMLISTGARVGTGNVAGVAAALAIGGPGAVFWMWVTALVGAASSFAESVLAQRYRQRGGSGCYGGAAFYIQQGMGSRTLGVLFTLALIGCFGGAMNALQAYQLQSTLRPYGIPPLVVALGLTALTALCIQRDGVGRWSEILVPTMAVGYLLMTLGVMALCWRQVPAMLGEIFRDAFAPDSLAGGLAGGTMSIGIRRGLFTNEAGMGSASQAAAAAEARHPADQGMAQVLSVFIDTLLLCSATAFMLLLSGVPAAGHSDIGWAQAAVSAVLGRWAVHGMTAAVLCFAFTSILGGYYYTASASLFLSGSPWLRRLMQAICLLTVFFGSLAQAELVWQLTDLAMAVMVVLNLAALWYLRREVVDSLRQW